MSLFLPFRGVQEKQSIITPPDTTPDPGEMAQPPFAGSLLLAQDDFTTAGGYSLSNFGGPPGNNPWPMSTNAPPPAGAFYGPQSSKVTVNPGGWLEGYFDKASSPIIVNYGGTNYNVYRNGHYIVWNGAGGAARMRSGVLVYKQQYPPKFSGMGHVNLMWPTDEKWPQHGEHDMTENYSGSFMWQASNGVPGFEINIHYGDGTAENRVFNKKVNNFDLTKPHIQAFCYHAGDDAAGTNCYLASFVNDGTGWSYKWGLKYNDVISYSWQTYNPRASGNRSGRPGTDMIPHGANAVTMNLRQQTEAYGSTDAVYTGGRQAFKFFWYQAWQPLTLAQMQAKGYLL